MPKPMLIFAHRGAKDLAPENTLSAFEKAIQLGANGLETDILVTSDDIPILSHNNELRLLSTHQGRVHQVTYESIKDLDVGSHFGSNWAHERIPTLQTALELFSKSSLKIVLEVKKQDLPAAKAIASIGKVVLPYFGKIDLMFSSFSSLLLWELKKQFPQFPRALLSKSRFGLHWLSPLEKTLLKASAITPFHQYLSPRFVNWAKKHQLPVYTWTVNTPQDMLRAQALGVDGIITDHVQIAQQVLYTHDEKKIL